MIYQIDQKNKQNSNLLKFIMETIRKTKVGMISSKKKKKMKATSFESTQKIINILFKQFSKIITNWKISANFRKWFFFVFRYSEIAKINTLFIHICENIVFSHKRSLICQKHNLCYFDFVAVYFWNIRKHYGAANGNFKDFDYDCLFVTRCICILHLHKKVDARAHGLGC